MTENESSVVMTGRQLAKDYLRYQKAISWIYLGGFYRTLEQDPRSGRFLEIGSGPGFQTAEVMQRLSPREIVCVEPSRDMLDAAGDYMAERGFSKKIRMVEGFVEDTTLLGSLGQFDLIYSTLSMHHWGNPIYGLKNLMKVIKPDGLIVIYDFRATHEARQSKVNDIRVILAAAGIDNYSVKNGLIFRTVKIARPGVPLS
jgi:SAM-dependent methyltransferase